MTSDASDLLALAAGLRAAERELPDGLRLVGIGWGTVDLERTVGGLPDLAFGPEVGEPLLGARARVALVGGVGLAVLEPTTEARLAAALARRGEGIACLYVSGPGRVPPTMPASPASAPTARSLRSALGRPGRVLPHDRPWGPYLVLVDPAS
jgi:hypothetical protein